MATHPRVSTVSHHAHRRVGFGQSWWMCVHAARRCSVSFAWTVLAVFRERKSFNVSKPAQKTQRITHSSTSWKSVCSCKFSCILVYDDIAFGRKRSRLVSSLNNKGFVSHFRGYTFSLCKIYTCCKNTTMFFMFSKIKSWSVNGKCYPDTHTKCWNVCLSVLKNCLRFDHSWLIHIL